MKQNKPFIIGLTGTIGSGKSTCSKILKDKFNLPVIDADEIAYKVCKKDGPGLEKIAQVFGKDYILPDGKYNRAKMSKTVFNNPEALEKLNKILHPIIKEEKENQINQLKNEEIIIYDCPLLIEAKEDNTVDHILLITAPEEIRKERLQERNGYSEQEVDKRIEAQLSEEEKIDRADTVIFNNGSRDQLELALTDFINNIREELRKLS